MVLSSELSGQPSEPWDHIGYSLMTWGGDNHIRTYTHTHSHPSFLHHCHLGFSSFSASLIQMTRSLLLFGYENLQLHLAAGSQQMKLKFSAVLQTGFFLTTCNFQEVRHFMLRNNIFFFKAIGLHLYQSYFRHAGIFNY